jgi:hypothetical protein
MIIREIQQAEALARSHMAKVIELKTTLDEIIKAFDECSLYYGDAPELFDAILKAKATP